MKKYLITTFLVLSLILSLTACNREIERNETTSNLTNIDLSATEEDKGGADILPRKYRDNFYSMPASFADIVGNDLYDEWEKEYLKDKYPDDTKEMLMVAYVKAFNISREDFDKANIEYAKFIDKIYSDDGAKNVICLEPQDFADQEFNEIFNADIIYTFDNEIISEYYLGIDYPFLNEYQYVEALEEGTYQTRTTKFITVEQMEADFIAKYGEESLTKAYAQNAATTTEQTRVEE